MTVNMYLIVIEHLDQYIRFWLHLSHMSSTLLHVSINAHANVHVYISSVPRDLSPHLRRYFVYASREGSGKSAHMSLCCSAMR